jgi:hypothetical protein
VSSTLDTKYWFNDPRPPLGLVGYEHVLDPPQCNADITYWLDYHWQTQNVSQVALEPSMQQWRQQPPNERTFRLRPQDRFLRENIQGNDILIVSIGGNDVAMAPTPCTIILQFVRTQDAIILYRTRMCLWYYSMSRILLWLWTGSHGILSLCFSTLSWVSSSSLSSTSTKEYIEKLTTTDQTENDFGMHV